MLKHKYLSNTSIMHAWCSYTWSSTIKALEFLKKGFIYRVGRADISLFYEGPICGMLDYLHISDTNLVVKDVLVNGQWN